MPNWVRQRVIVKEPQMLKKYLINEKGEVDFNILKPRHEDLNIECGSNSYVIPCEWNSSYREESIKKQEKFNDILESMYKDDISQEEFLNKTKKNELLIRSIKKTMKIEDVDVFIKGFFNYKRYGYVDWYDWSRENWGTKWNASTYSQYVADDYSEAEFETAWCMVHPIYAALAKYTPLRVVYADEDIGSNCGMYDFFTNKEGEVVFQEVLEGSDELACDTWGYGTMDTYDENGNIIEDEENEAYKEAQVKYFNVQEEIKELMNADKIGCEV